MGNYLTLRDFVYSWIGLRRSVIYETSGNMEQDMAELREDVANDVNPLLLAKGEEPIDPMDPEMWHGTPGEIDDHDEILQEIFGTSAEDSFSYYEDRYGDRV